MSGTTNKRVVSRKKIVPVAKPEPVEVIQEQPVEDITEEPVVTKKNPTIKVVSLDNYTNWSIGEGINWKAGSVHEVDFQTYQRIKADNPNGFEGV